MLQHRLSASLKLRMNREMRPRVMERIIIRIMDRITVAIPYRKKNIQGKTENSTR